MIASGARPYRPADVDFTHPRIFDSDTILDLSETPQSITIYGAGVVGCEYASMFRNLGCKVNLVNTRDRLLEFLDDEIIDALSYHLRDRGVILRHHEECEQVEGLRRRRGAASEERQAAQDRHSAVGQRPDGQLRRHGLGSDRHRARCAGNLTVNENFQTSVPHIYAVGDVIGFPALASAAYMQGRAAATHILEGRCDRLVRDIPTGIYTSPEISSLGKTERELTATRSPTKSAMRSSRAWPAPKSPARPSAC